jgi:hypothetical protein
MTLSFEGPIWFWKGPAPHYFITVPHAESEELRDVQRSVTYGWGMIPVTARIGNTEWTTSLFPKDGGFIVPVKTAVRSAEKLDAGDIVSMQLYVDLVSSSLPTQRTLS